MAHLACIHHVSWLSPVPGGKHECLYCREIVTKKDIYPKFENLGVEFQQKWDLHEKGESAPAPSEPPGS